MFLRRIRDMPTANTNTAAFVLAEATKVTGLCTSRSLTTLHHDGIS